jgi:hypothetical protein
LSCTVLFAFYVLLIAVEIKEPKGFVGYECGMFQTPLATASYHSFAMLLLPILSYPLMAGEAIVE